MWWLNLRMITPSITFHKQAVESSEAEIRPDLQKVNAVIDSLQFQSHQIIQLVHNLYNITNKHKNINTYLCPFNSNFWSSESKEASFINPTSNGVIKILPSALPENRNLSKGSTTIAVIGCGKDQVCKSVPFTSSHAYL